jgi:hypothetical protein
MSCARVSGSLCRPAPGIQREERLILADVLRQVAKGEDFAVMAGHGENRGPRTARLHRDDGLVLPGEGFGGAEELQDLAFSLA